MEVQCAGCGETLKDFACPGCGAAQRLPPEFMPQPRPRRAIPLPATAGRAAAAARHRVPCGCSGALITTWSWSLRRRRSQGSAPATGVAIAQLLPPEPQVLGDPQSHAGQVHPERYKALIHLEQSQGWRSNHSTYRAGAFSSLRADKGVHGGPAQGDSYSHVHVDLHAGPLETSSLVVGDSDPHKRRRFHGSLSKGSVETARCSEKENVCVYERRVKARNDGNERHGEAPHEHIHKVASKRKESKVPMRTKNKPSVAARTTAVPRDDNLPPRRGTGKGKGVASSSCAEDEEEEQQPQGQPTVGPLRLHIPTPSDYGRRTVNYKGQAKQVKKERESNPFVYERLSSDYRFYNHFQQDFYETVIYPRKDPISKMQWVDWKYMEEKDDPIFKEVTAACESKGVKRIMGFKYGWCNEVIAQFYATVYFDKNKAKTMHWMTEGEWYKIKYMAFSRLLGFGQDDANKERIHVERALTNSQIEFMYNPHDEDITLGSIKGLLLSYCYLNRLFRKTLAPKEGDANSIMSTTRNLLARMDSSARTFNVFDFIWEEIRLTSLNPSRSCGYAPYLMYMIEKVTKKNFVKEVKHEPVRIRPRKGSPPVAAPRRAPHSSSPTHKPFFSSSVHPFLKSIFCICKNNSMKLDKYNARLKKINQRLKAIQHHLNIGPPCSLDGSEVEESDPEVFEDLFEAYEVGAAASASAPAGHDTRLWIEQGEELGDDEETEMETEEGDDDDDGEDDEEDEEEGNGHEEGNDDDDDEDDEEDEEEGNGHEEGDDDDDDDDEDDYEVGAAASAPAPAGHDPRLWIEQGEELGDDEETEEEGNGHEEDDDDDDEDDEEDIK